MTRYAAALLLASTVLAAQQPTPKPTTAAEAPTRDTSYIDAQGTAHVTRVVPVPADLSPQAQRSVARAEPDQGPPQSLADRRSSHRRLGRARGGDLEQAVPQHPRQ